MADIRGKITEIYSLEQLSQKNTVMHRIHPLPKILVTMVYIICVMLQGRYNVFALAPFLFYPILTMALGEIPFTMIGKRALIALPFGLFIGISNIVLEPQPYMQIGRITLSYGVMSCLMILMRIALCVSAVLILVAITPFSRLTGQLRRMHVPVIFVRLIEMTYRYIGVLLMEADTMLLAYRMRNPKVKWPMIGDMGSFIGQLFLRSYDRAERIYQAMQCRGYGKENLDIYKMPLKALDFLFLIGVSGAYILLTIMR